MSISTFLGFCMRLGASVALVEGVFTRVCLLHGSKRFDISSYNQEKCDEYETVPHFAWPGNRPVNAPPQIINVAQIIYIVMCLCSLIVWNH